MMALMFGSVYQVNKSNIRQQEQQIVSDLKTNPEYQGKNIDVKLKLENRNRTLNVKFYRDIPGMKSHKGFLLVDEIVNVWGEKQDDNTISLPYTLGNPKYNDGIHDYWQDEVFKILGLMMSNNPLGLTFNPLVNIEVVSEDDKLFEFKLTYKIKRRHE